MLTNWISLCCFTGTSCCCSSHANAVTSEDGCKLISPIEDVRNKLTPNPNPAGRTQPRTPQDKGIKGSAVALLSLIRLVFLSPAQIGTHDNNIVTSRPGLKEVMNILPHPFSLVAGCVESFLLSTKERKTDRKTGFFSVKQAKLHKSPGPFGICWLNPKKKTDAKRQNVNRLQ